MPRTKLQETVHQLRHEIEAGEPLRPEHRELLSDALSEIEALLAAEDGDEPADASIADRLREASDNFEDTHPNLTLAVGAVADALSKMGI